jgi:hypothetical protein
MTIQTCASCNAQFAGDENFCRNCGTPRPTQPVETAPTSLAPKVTIPSSGQNVKHPMSSRSKMIYASIATLLFGSYLYFYFVNLPGKPNPIVEKQPSVAMAAAYAGEPLEQQDIQATVANGYIIFPLTVVLDKKIVAFDYDAGTTKIPLLAFINSDGKLVTAFRFCEPCNSKKFRIEGNILACGSCETQWRLNTLEGLQGNCQKYPPAPFPSEVVNNIVRIEENVVKNWKIRM